MEKEVEEEVEKEVEEVDMFLEEEKKKKEGMKECDFCPSVIKSPPPSKFFQVPPGSSSSSEILQVLPGTCCSS